MNHITPANSPHGSTVECWSDNADSELKKGDRVEIVAWNISRVQVLIKGVKKWVKAQYFKTIATEEEKKQAQREAEERFRYYQNGGNNGPTGHGDECFSDADQGM